MTTPTFDAGVALVDGLRKVGLRATNDPRNVNPPCLLLDRPSLLPVGNGCNRQVEWVLHAIVTGGDNALSWRSLDEMVQQVFALHGAQVTACTPETWPLNDTTDAPAYRIELQTII